MSESEKKNLEEVVLDASKKVEEVSKKIDAATELVEQQIKAKDNEEKIIENAKNKLVEAATNKIENSVNNIVTTALDETLGDIQINENIGDTTANIVSELTEDISRDLINKVHAEVKEKLGDIGVKSSTLTIIIKYTIEAIENTPVKGKAQLDFAMKIIGDLINELDESDEKLFLLKTLDNGGIRDTIELVVDASKGKVNINQVTQTATSNCLIPCFEYLFQKCR